MAHGTLITVFVVIAAVAIVIQMLILLAFYLAVRRFRKEANRVGHEAKQCADSIVQAVLDIISVSREPIKTVTMNAADISRVIRDRTGTLDEAVSEITERTLLQARRIDQLISDLIGKMETTADAVQRNVLSPLQEISAIVKGVQSGLDFLFSRRPSSTVREATQDEEMFI